MEKVTFELERRQWNTDAPGAQGPKQALAFWRAITAK